MGELTPTVLWAGAASVLAGAVIGGVIGSGIPLWWARRLRRIERRGELIGMLVEMHLSLIDMNALQTDNFAAPLYRLPVSIFKQALPKLIGEKGLGENGVSVLVEYMNRVEELNRGLDRAGSAHAARDAILIAEESSRNKLKAETIRTEKSDRHEDQTLYDGAWAALTRLEDAEVPWWVRIFGQMRWPWRRD
jgi:hypothetical protein